MNRIENNGYLIREATQKDVSPISELVNKCYWDAQTYLEDNMQKYRTNEKEVLNYIKNKKIYVLIKNEEIGGVILYDSRKAEEASFGLFAVTFKGCGKLLINHVESKACEEGKSKMVIEAISCAKALVEYYKRLNYCETGEKHLFSTVSQAKLKKGYEDSTYLVLEKN